MEDSEEIHVNDAIKSFHLKKGANKIQFSFNSDYQGIVKCFCDIFLWHHTDTMVISDVDGTITKSDVRGQVLGMIDHDWSQGSVAKLFDKISKNGYHMVYLSARAMGQISITKDYLASVKQEGVKLPQGPIFLNPTSLSDAFHLEVIEKKPEIFKIATLKIIKSLFPEETNPSPFHAGFGNTSNDLLAYQTVGIPIVRNYTANSKGELKYSENENIHVSSYAKMVLNVDKVFPNINSTNEVGEISPGLFITKTKEPMTKKVLFMSKISRYYLNVQELESQITRSPGAGTPAHQVTRSLTFQTH